MNPSNNHVPRVIGHRGAPRAHRENTLASFAGAIDQGADGVEFDVRRTADGDLVVHHDARTTAGQVIVSTATGELAEAIPHLDVVLDAVVALAVVNVEIKDLPGDPGHDHERTTARATARLLATRSHTTNVVVSSFDPGALVAFSAEAAGLGLTVALGLLVDVGATAGSIEQALTLGATALHPHDSDVDAALVAAAHGAGLAVNVWTANDPDRIRALAVLGVDAVVTDVPDVARAALGLG